MFFVRVAGIFNQYQSNFISISRKQTFDKNDKNDIEDDIIKRSKRPEVMTP